MSSEPATVEALQAEVLRHEAIQVRCGGTKSRDAEGATISLRGLSGIVDYSPDEGVITALAGTPLAEIDRALGEHRQYLPFDPPLASAGATIGGTVAAGASGPLRYRYGGVRDFVIGARVIDGEGRSIRSGGKVVKNAAGFLLHHAMVGSLGRFGVLSEVTLKVFPLPEARATIGVDCRRLDAAAAAARALEARRFDLEALDFDAGGMLWVRIAGRAEALRGRLSAISDAVRGMAVADADEDLVWTSARDFAWAESGQCVAKIPLSGPSASQAMSAATAAGLTPLDRATAGPPERRTRLRYTCGGRCAWVAVDDVPSLSAGLSAAGLSGVIIRGPQAGASVGVVQANVFDEHVRRVLDPRDRFRAASDPR